MYGAFETLSDPSSQRRLLFELGLNFAATEAEKKLYEKAGAEDDDDLTFQWWWEATVPDVEKAAEEAEGAEMDLYAASWVSDGLASAPRRTATSCALESAMAGQPLGQCTAKMATSIVTMRGILIQRVAKPNNSNRAPIASV